MSVKSNIDQGTNRNKEEAFKYTERVEGSLSYIFLILNYVFESSWRKFQMMIFKAFIKLSVEEHT